MSMKWLVPLASIVLLSACGKPTTVQKVEEPAAGGVPKVEAISRDNGADLLLAFKSAFGQPAPYTQTSEDGSELVFAPAAFVNLQPGIVALISKAEIPDGCHACSGHLSIHYLRHQNGQYEVLGAWPDVGGLGPYGKAANWSLRSDLDAVPTLVAISEDGGQGCSGSQADLIALTPTGPKVRAKAVLLASEYDGGGESSATPSFKYEGTIGGIERGKSFYVNFTGSKNISTKYTSYENGGEYYASGDVPPSC
jgi:hypothetical protein